jgi:type VI secretion system secreted protein VgrG
VTGFPPGVDADGLGAIYLAGSVPLAAQSALATAYGAVAGTTATASATGDLSLLKPSATLPIGTFPPGVYASPATMTIASGNLTLNGLGNAQSVFIFQMGTTLTTTLNGTTSGNVILTNGASACNVYWQVGSSATLGGASFSGNVLANVSITLNAATFNGRALAQTGTVTIPIAGGSLITNPGGQ